MEGSPRILILVFTTFLGCLGLVMPDASDHRYEKGDQIPLYANKIGPFRNPSETYAYYDLPFCPPDSLDAKEQTPSKVFSGGRLIRTPYKLDFMVERSEVLCRRRLTVEEVSRFRMAVRQDYYMQMYYDDLPAWAFVGKVNMWRDDPKDYKYLIFTNFEFEIFYNGNYVIQINLRMIPSSVADISEDKEVEVEFLYTVKWKETHVPFEKRMGRYSSSSFLPHHMRKHAFSIMNSCVAVLLLIGCLVMLYVCVLKRDFYRFDDNEEEKGWKSLHGDVFRHPKHKCLFAAALGSGTHLLTVVVSILVSGLFGIFRPYDGGLLLISLVIIYAITSGIAAFTSMSFYNKLEGSNWARNLLLTGCLFGAPLLLTFCFANSVAIVYGSTAAVPLITVLLMLLLCIFLASPFLLLGAIFAKNIKSEFQVLCRTTKIPREIPPMRWNRGVIPQMVSAGLIPFGVIYVQLHYIFASVWGHRTYTMYKIVFIVFILLLIVTALVSIALTYFQLAAEDHQWWWRSFFCGGSTGFYVFGYCFYYYFVLSDMSGFMQTSFFFGYMACISYGIFLMLGTVGFQASLLFVRFIYASIKSD